jgi:hypothetical protein
LSGSATVADVEILGEIYSHGKRGDFGPPPKIPIGVDYFYVVIGDYRFPMDVDMDDGAAAKFLGLITDAVFRALAHERDGHDDSRGYDCYHEDA